jgi:hydroxymethylpyrimidine pyrophosphatase-like HAD family hydrolase
MLKQCGLGVAVANAIPALKELADATTNGSQGDVIVELIDAILSTTKPLNTSADN